MSFFRSFSRVLGKTGQANRAGAGANTAGEAVKPGAKPTTGLGQGAAGYLRRDKHSKKHAARVLRDPAGVGAGAAGAAVPAAPRQTPPAPVVDPKLYEEAKQKMLEEAKRKAQEEADALVRQAQDKSREILIEAKSQSLQLREQAERELREQQSVLANQQKSLEQQLTAINDRLKQVDRREEMLDHKIEDLDQKKQDLIAKREELVVELERVSGYTEDEAKRELLARLERTVEKQAAQLIRQKAEVAEAEADEKAKEILIDAMKHGATDYVAEYTVSVVRLPDADMKGRIIGKDGRNIRAFEQITGVDVNLDETPDEVRLSCFDPVRREIARITLERLLKDGRIQPSRIEEVVDKVASELDKIMFEEGKRLCHRVNIFNLPNEIIARLGRFKYRFSYGQNLIAHTLEETQIGIKLAQELGLNVRTVTLGCLLHDIGKVIEGEGNHVELGVNYLKRLGVDQAVIDCVAQHHEDEPFTSMESTLVYISDAISGSRPGARNENHEEYVHRLSRLEEIAMTYEGVERAFAIQAGREVRVILQPSATSDRDADVIATKLAEQYETEMTYPGTVTVTVIREVRGTAVAK